MSWVGMLHDPSWVSTCITKFVGLALDTLSQKRKASKVTFSSYLKRTPQDMMYNKHVVLWKNNSRDVYFFWKAPSFLAWAGRAEGTGRERERDSFSTFNLVLFPLFLFVLSNGRESNYASIWKGHLFWAEIDHCTRHLQTRSIFPYLFSISEAGEGNTSNRSWTQLNIVNSFLSPPPWRASNPHLATIAGNSNKVVAK